MLSKRFLLRLVTEGHVHGWDDPRMPTISGLRRRGYPADGIRDFAESIGVSKADSVVEIGQLEHAVRDVLNREAPRRFGVIDPFKLVIDNYPAGQSRAGRGGQQPRGSGSRHALSAVLARAVDRARRLRREPAAQVLPACRRVRKCACAAAYFVTCTDVVKDSSGNVVEVHATYDPNDTRRRCT